MIELIGWIATVMVILSFIQKDILKLRIISLIGSLLWLGYGLLLESYSIIFLNTVIMFIQIYWIHKIKKKTKTKD